MKDKLVATKQLSEYLRNSFNPYSQESVDVIKLREQTWSSLRECIVTDICNAIKTDYTRAQLVEQVNAVLKFIEFEPMFLLMCLRKQELKQYRDSIVTEIMDRKGLKS